MCDNLWLKFLIIQTFGSLPIDGYNTTYQKYSLARRFNTYFNFRIRNSRRAKSRSNKTKRQLANCSSERVVHPKTEKIKKEKQDQKLTQEKKTKGFLQPDYKKLPNRNLPISWQKTALWHVLSESNPFSGTYSKKFYKETGIATLKESAN